LELWAVTWYRDARSGPNLDTQTIANALTCHWIFMV